MSGEAGTNMCSTPLVYGFLCEETNVFYAFETQEEYLVFLNWLEGQPPYQAANVNRDPPTDEEILRNSERATEKIMEVFNDPIFQEDPTGMELE